MTRLLPLTIVLLSCFYFNSALAYSGYIGGGLHLGDYRFNSEFDTFSFKLSGCDISNNIDACYTVDSESTRSKSSGIVLKVGQYLNPNFAVELQYVLGLSSDSETIAKRDVEIELTQAVGLFAKPMAFLSENTKVYGLAGVGAVDVSIEDDGIRNFSPLGDDVGFAYGLGLEYEVQYGVFISTEYVVYLDTDDAQYDAFNLSMSMYVW
ncbi:MAG: porin family protein [Pseudomonadales bacterium]|nr:porin family protein [Pseudomonadales bacterium]